jgi:hypothetical protein
MSEIAVCPKCGVPECISHKCAWLNNGDIVYRDSPEIRLVLAESERIDPLFNYMEQLIGGPIENIVFTAARRTARLYLSQFVSSETRRLVREKKMDASQVIEELLGIGSLMGCGIQRLLDMRYKGDNDDYVLIRVVKPFSLLLQIARMAGGVEALFGSEQGYSVQETAPDTWDMKIVPSPHLDEMKLQTHLCGIQPRA